MRIEKNTSVLLTVKYDIIYVLDNLQIFFAEKRDYDEGFKEKLPYRGGSGGTCHV